MMKSKSQVNVIMLGLMSFAFCVTTAHAVPCKSTHKKVPIKIDLENGLPKDPGSTTVSGQPVNIVWTAPPGWFFDEGSIVFKNDPKGEFDGGHPGDAIRAAKNKKSKSQRTKSRDPKYHVCDQNTVKGTYKYTFTLYKANDPTGYAVDPAIVNDGERR